jgi:hypothetical protein
MNRSANRKYVGRRGAEQRVGVRGRRMIVGVDKAAARAAGDAGDMYTGPGRDR